MPDCDRPPPVTLRLHPDGHWVPNTVGRWLYSGEHHLDGVSPRLLFEVFDKHGSLMLREVGILGYDAVMAFRGRGTWEWVTPGTTPEADDAET